MMRYHHDSVESDNTQGYLTLWPKMRLTSNLDKVLRGVGMMDAVERVKSLRTHLRAAEQDEFRTYVEAQVSGCA